MDAHGRVQLKLSAFRLLSAVDGARIAARDSLSWEKGGRHFKRAAKHQREAWDEERRWVKRGGCRRCRRGLRASCSIENAGALFIPGCMCIPRVSCASMKSKEISLAAEAGAQVIRPHPEQSGGASSLVDPLSGALEARLAVQRGRGHRRHGAQRGARTRGQLRRVAVAVGLRDAGQRRVRGQGRGVDPRE